jgi:pimeloyl-ACP methyl ester carboxylesterase
MKRRKAFLGIAVGLPVLLLAGMAVIVGGSYLEHRRLVMEEEAAYPAPGKLVTVGADGEAAQASLHVYAEGEGDPTLVFLSGLGTSSPYYDFKVLFERLSNDYRVAVVERAGYGWSDVTASSRDLDTVLHETRTALQRAGENPPYVLFPHSLAGLEALYWANRYPDEIAAVIGLDPLVPGYIERSEEVASLSRVETVLARTGLIRSGPDVFARNFPAMVKGHLTEREAEVAETIFLRRTHTRNMWDEVRALFENALRVAKQGKPNLPVHVFLSDEGSEIWKDSVAAHARATGGEVILLDAGHYVHLDRPELIAESSRALIEQATANRTSGPPEPP